MVFKFKINFFINNFIIHIQQILNKYKLINCIIQFKIVCYRNEYGGLDNYETFDPCKQTVLPLLQDI